MSFPDGKLLHSFLLCLWWNPQSFTWLHAPVASCLPGSLSPHLQLSRAGLLSGLRSLRAFTPAFSPPGWTFRPSPLSAWLNLPYSSDFSLHIISLWNPLLTPKLNDINCIIFHCILHSFSVYMSRFACVLMRRWHWTWWRQGLRAWHRVGAPL